MDKLGVVIDGCALCKYLYNIFADRNAHGRGRTRVQQKGSALIHNKQRALTIRSSAGEWVFIHNCS
jgi:hypothetical protein